jgi:RNA polymerase sigma factor (sigma-70 family)
MNRAFSQSLGIDGMVEEQDLRISEAIVREQARLRNFIRRRVPDRLDAEDILQDVFAELVEAYRLMKPIEQVGAWLFRVARNRIIDLFRKKKFERLPDQTQLDSGGAALRLEDLLPSPAAAPDQQYDRSVLLEALENALDELPREQRDIFMAHEIDGRSFKELAAATGLSVNTLLSRKHYAVLHLRRRLQSAYDEQHTSNRKHKGG